MSLLQRCRRARASAGTLGNTHEPTPMQTTLVSTAGRPTAAGPSPPSRKRCNVPSFCIGRAFLPWIIRTRYGPQPEEKVHGHCMRKRLAGRPTADPRLVQAHVHPAGSAVRSRPFVSAGPFCRGSFALGTGRSPRRKPHGHRMWKRLPGRPTADPRLVQARRQSVPGRPTVTLGRPT